MMQGLPQQGIQQNMVHMAQPVGMVQHGIVPSPHQAVLPQHSNLTQQTGMPQTGMPQPVMPMGAPGGPQIPQRTFQNSSVSDAEMWLNSTASSINSDDQLNGTGHSMYASPIQQQQILSQQTPHQQMITPPPVNNIVQATRQIGHNRSQSVDSSDAWWSGQKAPTLRELATQGTVAQFQSQQQNGSSHNGSWSSLQSPPHPLPDADPFDAAWAAKASTQPSNQAFEVQL